jgi:hypothetical protein
MWVQFAIFICIEESFSVYFFPVAEVVTRLEWFFMLWFPNYATRARFFFFFFVVFFFVVFFFLY